MPKGTQATKQTARKTGRPPLEQNQEREKWQVQMRPDLIKNVRILAITEDRSPFDVIEDAVSAYLRDQPKR
jgi:hypothetical protein